MDKLDLESVFNGNAILNTDTFLEALTWAGNFKADSKYMKKMIWKKRKTSIYSDLSAKKESIIKKHGCKCDICGFDYKPLLQIHHILPVKMFGDNSNENIACLCPNCHKILHKTYEFIKKDSIADFLGLLSWVNRNYGKKAYEKYRDVLDIFFELYSELQKKFVEDNEDAYSD